MSDNGQPDYSDLAAIDRLIHEPARMAIMAALAGCESADFAFLLHVTGLTRGNLSAHAARLEEAGYVQIEKGFAGKVPHTEYSLTPAGRQAFQFYREQLKRTLTKLRGDGE